MTSITCTIHGHSTVEPKFLDCPWCLESERDRWQSVATLLADALEASMPYLNPHQDGYMNRRILNRAALTAFKFFLLRQTYPKARKTLVASTKTRRNAQNAAANTPRPQMVKGAVSRAKKSIGQQEENFAQPHHSTRRMTMLQRYEWTPLEMVKVGGRPGDFGWLHTSNIPGPILQALDSDDPRPIIGVVRQGERMQPMPYVDDDRASTPETEETKWRF